MGIYQNRGVVLRRRPQGELVDGDLELVDLPIPELGDGDILVEVHWLSLDPYMRPRLNDLKGYAEPVGIGDVIVGESVGRVVESKSDNYRVGDFVTCYSGWQKYFVARDSDESIHRIVDSEIPLQAYLGAAGMPGRTAYGGLMHLGKPKAGETVVVSAASGAVGSVVGQLAKELGCRAVGIAGGDAKCRYVTDELGFDECIDYKSGNLLENLKAACPKGIDVYYENVGGDVTKAVAQLLNPGARVPVCGFVSAYNEKDLQQIETPFHILGALENPPEHRFFLVSEWDDQHAETTQKLAGKVKDGSLKYRETIAEGLENAEDAFKGMLKGKNFGKQLVKVKLD